MTDDETLEINASPVKDFFIDIITRDVNIIDTIPEFVDNSIDGALRLRNEDEDLSDLRVEITLDEDKAVIKDNCGGISRIQAEEYAFRFGRPDEAEDLPSRIGEFGIGMKRSLFRLGNKFLVESYPVDEERFIIDVDVDDWKSDENGEDDWNFEGEVVSSDDPRCELDEPGTRIVIKKLNEQPSKEFGNDLFISRLEDKLTSRFSKYLSDGFQIILDNKPLGYMAIDLVKSDDFDPAYKEFTYEKEDSKIEVDLRAGLGESDPDKAGWYVFCNGRLVMEADQTENTVWSGDAIPKFHNQYNRFRGLINFTSEDSGSLPWNTTKTGINTDSPVYQRAQQEMVSISRPVIDFLNEIRQQQRKMELEEDENTPLEQKVEDADVVDSSEIDTDEDKDFSAPDPDEEEIEEDTDEDEPVYISYKRPSGKVEEVKEKLEVSTNKDVGIETFEFFYETQLD